MRAGGQPQTHYISGIRRTEFLVPCFSEAIKISSVQMIGQLAIKFFFFSKHGILYGTFMFKFYFNPHALIEPNRRQPCCRQISVCSIHCCFKSVSSGVHQCFSVPTLTWLIQICAADDKQKILFTKIVCQCTECSGINMRINMRKTQ